MAGRGEQRKGVCARECGHISKDLLSLVDVFVLVCAFLIHTHTVHRTWQLCLVSLATLVECCQGCIEHAQSDKTDRQTDRQGAGSGPGLQSH